MISFGNVAIDIGLRLRYILPRLIKVFFEITIPQRRIVVKPFASDDGRAKLLRTRIGADMYGCLGWVRVRLK